ncbi:MAG TPA: polysaccharide lyase family 7 protein [Tepidisphaeraceae bacterium]|nr:polysaccharide lyase family 7 protein [Tepidisphaeraceae bacterium]
MRNAGIWATVFCTGVAVLAAGVLADPTDGWSPQRLSFNVQYPYNVNKGQRYTYTNGIYHLWVFNNDKPFSERTRTLPRTEMRFPEYEKPQEEQFEADVMVPRGTNNVCIVQIHTSDQESPKYGPTVFMLDVRNDGDLRHYADKLLDSDIYGKWVHVNVIHNVPDRQIQCYINNRLVGQYKANAAKSFYFKCGVYEQRGGSDEMQVYFRNVKLWSRQ